MNNLLELADNINLAYERSQQLYADGIDYLRLALLNDREIGESLMKVKSDLAYGEFTPWIEENCSFSRSHAYRLIAIASNWDKIIATCPTRETSTELVLPTLRAALAQIATAESKPEASSPPQAIKYKVALKTHPCYGETVEVKQELNHGDILLCKTKVGDFAFIKKELVPESVSLEPVDTEIIDVEVTDNSEQLKEAIALIIEYLPETELKQILVLALDIGTHYLPSDAQGMAVKLIGSQEVLAINSVE